MYDHILSIAHTADCLIPEIEPEFNEAEFQLLSRCIVYHDLCEVLLGDIPSFTRQESITYMNRVNLTSIKLLNRYKPEERDRITNDFLKMYLEDQERTSMELYETIIGEKDSKLNKLFVFLDQIDPIIAVWRYLHHYKGKLRDIKKFLEIMNDFFIYPKPKKVTSDYIKTLKITQDNRVDLKIEELVNNLMNSSNALNYYEGNSIANIFPRIETFMFKDNFTITRLVEGRKIIFTEKSFTRKK